jgi:hypothetical protein
MDGLRTSLDNPLRTEISVRDTAIGLSFENYLIILTSYINLKKSQLNKIFYWL